MDGASRLTLVVSHDGEIDGPLPALLPAGVYQLTLSHWTTYKLFGRTPKLSLWFKVVQQGPHFGAIVPRHYNVKALKGAARRNGQFKVAPNCDLVREYARLLPQRLWLSPLSPPTAHGPNHFRPRGNGKDDAQATRACACRPLFRCPRASRDGGLKHLYLDLHLYLYLHLPVMQCKARLRERFAGFVLATVFD